MVDLPLLGGSVAAFISAYQVRDMRGVGHRLLFVDRTKHTRTFGGASLCRGGSGTNPFAS